MASNSSFGLNRGFGNLAPARSNLATLLRSQHCSIELRLKPYHFRQMLVLLVKPFVLFADLRDRPPLWSIEAHGESACAAGNPEFVSLSHLRKYSWVLPIFEYDDEKHLLASLEKSVVGPAEDLTKKLRT